MELNQLVLCKQLYNEAEGFLSRKESVAFGLAVSIAQDAVELFLRAVIKQLPSNGQKPPEEFIKCMDYIDAAASGKEDRRVPFRARMSELNKARVNFKHYGLVPNEADAARLLGYAAQFFETATPQFFVYEFTNISLADLITSLEVRQKVKAAELAEREGDISEALGSSAEAVELAASALLNRLQPRDIGFLPRALKDLLGWDGESQFTRYMGEQFEKANRASLALALSLNLNDLVRFRMLVPFVRRLVGGNMSRQQMHDESAFTIDDATFAVAFATRYALAVDARMPTDRGAWPQEGEDPLANL
ncbi:hypothetical protein [Burkholderia cepacia]|uniref:hypothetical protein n=1 Tax=Burkholderia cepacia TaxID=292 RepID=UPI001CF3058B|nr:hypothetical protein [Burkholderia cepacia]MCA8115575.1 hypothetical protein [Burkholderia cepacia]MCA8402662.1 hypothetical protein [Burkholderia cepacia]